MHGQTNIKCVLQLDILSHKHKNLMEVNNQMQGLPTLLHGKDSCYPLDTNLGGSQRRTVGYSEVKGLWIWDSLRSMKIEVAGAYGTKSYQTTRRHIPAEHIHQKISAPAGLNNLDLSGVRLVA